MSGEENQWRATTPAAAAEEGFLKPTAALSGTMVPEQVEVMEMMESGRCPDCGAPVQDGRQGCQALWDELSAGQSVPHAAAFDAYCMQHPERYCASAKSYAAHLTRLCCGIEYRGAPRIYAAIQRWLNGSRRLQKPAVLPFFGALTIADVYQASSPRQRMAVTHAWVESVWAAYAPQHDLAHLWIRQALGTGTASAALHSPRRRKR